MNGAIIAALEHIVEALEAWNDVHARKQAIEEARHAIAEIPEGDE